MDILIVMCIGILVGRFVSSRRIKKVNEWISLACTLILIFSMGAMLGGREHFVEEFSSLGLVSFLYFLIPTACSVVLVYGLTQRFLQKKSRRRGEGEVEE